MIFILYKNQLCSSLIACEKFTVAYRKGEEGVPTGIQQLFRTLKSLQFVSFDAT